MTMKRPRCTAVIGGKLVRVQPPGMVVNYGTKMHPHYVDVPYPTPLRQASPLRNRAEYRSLTRARMWREMRSAAEM